MDDKDHVFARFKDDKPEPANRRETLNIPRRNGATGSRTVEVVHLRSGGATRDRPQRPDVHLRAASWDDGFPAKKAFSAPEFAAPPAAGPAPPKAHVMPAWAPAVTEPPPAPPPEATPDAEPRRGRGRPRKPVAATPARPVADPFDTADDGANCLRCGYLVEPAREKRGLLTCAGCDAAG